MGVRLFSPKLLSAFVHEHHTIAFLLLIFMGIHTKTKFCWFQETANYLGLSAKI